MQVSFQPSTLSGAITIPPSKSFSHRSILCAALADGVSKIDNVIFSKDILATLDGVKSLGAQYRIEGNSVTITGIQAAPQEANIDCCESGSTLRFLIPIASALGVSACFSGRGKLPTRPITPYLSEMGKNGVQFEYQHTMPFSVSGQLQPGEYSIEGNISSQFITGLLFALPLLPGESQIIIQGRLESKPYVTMTTAILNQFGITVQETDAGYRIPGNQSYQPCDYQVEGDFSQAAFFAVAAAIGEKPLLLQGLNPNSVQGDKEILRILKGCGGNVEESKEGIFVHPILSPTPFQADVSDIPDLVPILGVLGSRCKGVSKITGAGRLKIKESDRLAAISEALNRLGGKLFYADDWMEMEGPVQFQSGVANSSNDHRIAMSVAIAALTASGTVTLTQAESVEKSYPDFYRDYQKLGGICHVVHME